MLYLTILGKSKAFANLLNEVFLHGFDSKVYCMQDYRVTDIENEQCVLFVASTFGNGEPPDNGQVNRSIVLGRPHSHIESK